MNLIHSRQTSNLVKCSISTWLFLWYAHTYRAKYRCNKQFPGNKLNAASNNESASCRAYITRHTQPSARQAASFRKCIAGEGSRGYRFRNIYQDNGIEQRVGAEESTNRKSTAGGSNPGTETLPLPRTEYAVQEGRK